MKKNLLFLVSNLRAVALCLAIVCSVFAGWADVFPGMMITLFPFNYKVINSSQCSVCYYWNDDESALIPEQADYYGEVLTVTGITGQCFGEKTNLSEVTIPATVTEIGASSFGNCTSLTKVICLGATPPVCDEFAFNGVDVTKVSLVVPTGCEGAYKKADVWKDFGKIVDPAGVEGVTVDDNAVEVERYDINGVKLSAPQAGVNIVKMSDGSVKKVVVSE